jgi:aminoglycoside 6'-N-acetyltransferase I
VNAVLICPATPADCQELARLRAALWPGESAEEHARELAPILAGRGASTLPAAHFVAVVDGVVIGFVEVGLRSHADGCDPAHPVGFLEGWYVANAHRRRGIGAQLIRAAEAWARTQGCIEMASDTWLDHAESQRAHQALGYEEVDRCVHYRKSL